MWISTFSYRKNVGNIFHGKYDLFILENTVVFFSFIHSKSWAFSQSHKKLKVGYILPS